MPTKTLYDIGWTGTRAFTDYTKKDHSLDSSTDEVGALMCAGTTDAITHIGLLTDSIAGTPPTYKVSIQGDSSGYPDGTIKGGGSPASAEFTPTSWGSDEVHWVALDNTYTPSSLNEYIWIVVEYVSGTVDASNRLRMSYAHSFQPLNNGVGFGAYTTNNWSTKAVAPGPPAMGIRTASDRLGGLFSTLASSATTSTILSTNGHRAVAKFTADTDLTILGFVSHLTFPSSGDLIFGIWDASGTSLTEVTHNAQQMTSSGVDRYTGLFSSSYDLVEGTDYYIGIERVANQANMYYVPLEEADDRLMSPRGTNVCLSTWDGSAWTDDTTRLPTSLALIATSIGGAGGGGGGGGSVTEALKFVWDIGSVPSTCSSNASNNTVALNGSNDEYGALMFAQTTDPITHIALKIYNDAGTPPTYKVSIQGNTLGFPDGTIKGGASPASATFETSAWDHFSVIWVELDNSYTPSSINEEIWVVVEYDSGTIDTSNHTRFSGSYTSLFSYDKGLNLASTTTNNWSSKSTQASASPAIGLRTASERFGYVVAGNTVRGTTTLSTNGHRQAIKFEIANAVTIDAISLLADIQSPGDTTFGIWNAAGTALSSVTTDATSFSNTAVYRYTLSLASPYTLDAATTYYIGMERVSATCSLAYTDYTESDDRLTTPLGTDACFSSWDGSSWTDVLTRVPYNIGLHVTDVATSGGGSVIVIEDD